LHDCFVNYIDYGGEAFCKVTWSGPDSDSLEVLIGGAVDGCKPCTSGLVSISGSTSCVECPAGKYQAETQCNDCAEGTSSNAGANFCSNVCEAGSYSSDGLGSTGKWTMKTYSFEGRFDCSSAYMPDVTKLNVAGQADVKYINFLSKDNFTNTIPGTPKDKFAATWQGMIVVKKAGTYTFCTESDDGSDLTIDNSLVINNRRCPSKRYVCPTDPNLNLPLLLGDFAQNRSGLD
jgi:hypothetical protein